MFPTSQRLWFITGCDKGLGYAIAEAALEKGDRVVATVFAADGKSALSEQFGTRCLSRHLDVTDSKAVHEAVQQAEEEFGGIDVVVNNAGYGLVGAAEEIDSHEYRPMFEVNFFGLVEVTRAALAGMRRRRRGHIINLSSLVGFVGAPGFAFYSASKFAVEGFSESLAKEVGPLGIKVTMIEPGGFRSDFAGGSLARSQTMIEDYASTSGATRDYLSTRHGTQPGDPALLGAVLTRLVDIEDPPLRLPLGRDALEQVSDKANFVRAELDKWSELSLSTNFVAPDASSESTA
ncbi:oxidoreductase [Burkholderia sp. S171]|uniref:oxidoreductase n=1 Tax=Burkholderia sp. S171 TaxID=1641860 RepID=UPI00131EC924|nr:oxidoreductase [Burkholderia sp. S171]